MSDDKTKTADDVVLAGAAFERAINSPYFTQLNAQGGAAFNDLVYRHDPNNTEPAYFNPVYEYDRNDTGPAYIPLSSNIELASLTAFRRADDTPTVPMITIDPNTALIDTQVAGSTSTVPIDPDSESTPSETVTPETSSLVSPANETPTAADYLNRHSATGGSFTTRVPLPDGEMAGSHVLMMNQAGEVVGYLHYNEMAGTVNYTEVNENSPLPDGVAELFTDAENPAISYGPGIVQPADTPENTAETAPEAPEAETEVTAPQQSGPNPNFV